MTFNPKLNQHLTEDVHNVLEVAGYTLQNQSEKGASYFKGNQQLVFTYGWITHTEAGRMRFSICPPNEADFTDISDVLITFKAIPLTVLKEFKKQSAAIPA